jgi:hypothetical protein
VGVLLALLSGMMWGTADFLGGTLSRRLPAIAVVIGSQACAAVLMVVIATVTGSWDSAHDYIPWGIAAGASGLAGLGLFYTALAQGTMGIVSPIAAMGVLVPIGLGLFLGQVPNGGQILGIIVAIIGIVLASGPELSGASSARPVVLSALAAIGFGVSLACIAQGSQTSVVMTMTTMRLTSVTIGIGLFLVVRNFGGMRPRDVPMLTLTGGFDVFANVGYGFASQIALLPVVAVLGSLYPVATIMLAWRVHHERLMPVQYVGVTVALLGVVMISAFGVI